MRKILYLTLLVLVAAVLSLRALRPSDGARGGGASAASPPRGPEAELEHGVAGASGAAEEDVASASRTAAADADPAVATEPRAADRELDLSGVVLDDTGNPVPEARVTALRREGDGYSLLRRAEDPAEREVAGTHSASDGSFALRVAPGRQHRLRVAADGFATAHLAGLLAGQRVEVRLGRGAIVRGRVTRKDGGEPVAGARVRIETRPEGTRALPRVRLAEGETDRDGAFHLAGVPPGPAWLVVAPPSLGGPPWEPLDVPMSGELVRDFALTPCKVFEGRVTDAVTGAPIEGARVGPVWEDWAGASTDADGRYVVDDLPDRHRELACDAPGYGRETRLVRRWEELEGRATIDFALTPARRVMGRVVDPAGVAVADAFVAACAADYAGVDHQQRADFVGGRTDADGRFELAGLHPEMRHALLLRREGLGTSVFDFPGTELESPVVDLGKIVLREGALVSGRVVDRRGEPLAGRDVRLIGWNADRAALSGVHASGASHVDSYVGERVARTDDLGRYAFADVPAGTFVVRAVRTLRSYSEREVVVDAGSQPRVPDLVLDGGLSIAGRVVASDGGPLPRTYLSVDPEEAGGSGDDIELPGDGAFEVTNLEPGSYSLHLYAYASAADEAVGRRFASHEVRHVEAGTSGLELTLPREAAIAGLIVDTRGDPAAGATVWALDEEGYVTARADADEKGRFDLRVGDGRPYDLAASPAGEAGRSSPPPPLLRGVTPGEPPVVLELP